MLKTSERATWFFSKYAPGPEISKKPFSMALTMASEPKNHRYFGIYPLIDRYVKTQPL